LGRGNVGTQPAPAQPAPERPAPQPAPAPQQPPVDQNRANDLTNWFGALGGMFIALGNALQLASSVGQPRALNA
ncbi:MAG TPA: hypothetical protein VND93_20480, partial [Myxococcales bacterium]|nr:hypothetical protein [Myxococcales bacterium]